MSDRRHVRLDLAASALFFAGLGVALAVFSHDPAAPTANLLGAPGHWIAAELEQLFGVAVYVLLGTWFVLVLMLLLRRNLRVWTQRLVGWLLLLPGTMLAAEPFGFDEGTLGAWLSTWLHQTGDWVGPLALGGGCLLVGVLLSFDFALIAFARIGWQSVGLTLGTLWAVVRWCCKRRRAPQPKPLAIKKPVQAPAIAAPVEAKPSAPAAEADESAGQIIPIHRPGRAAVEAEAPEPAPAVPSTAAEYADYQLPGLNLLGDAEPIAFDEQEPLLREQATLLEKTFADFNLSVRVVGIHTGPVVTQYEVALETGLRVHKVTALGDDLALNLKVPSVRIVAPIPGKNTVGIEVPNEHRAKVRMKEVILAASPRVATRGLKLPLFLGKDTEGKPLVYDLAEMPHLLIAGRTGTGKSVCMNALIISLLMTRRPDEVKMIMIDPKMLELIEYSKIPHLMHPVVKDMKKAEAILSWAVDKMEERYDILSRARVRNIAGYNELAPEEILRRLKPADDEERQRIPERMPYIVIFIDEMADLMMTMKKEVEGHIIRLAQKSRAAGIHLVVATQKPTVDVITGLIKSNLPARVCFQVSSRTDSRVVLDEMGADKLLGKGDMLFLQPGTSTLIRAQGTFLADEEITEVVESLECEPNFAPELVKLNSAAKNGGNFLEAIRERDDLYEQAIELVIREGRGSVSLLQRALGIGYGRAARLVDYMAEDGIVGEYNGSQARDVLYTLDQWDEVKQGGKLAESA